MKFRLILFISVFIALGITSCSKDSLTDGEELGVKIEKVIHDNNITSANVYGVAIYNGYSSYTEIVSGPVSVDGQLIKVGGYEYNLDQLIKFGIDGTNLNLYFNELATY